MHATATTLVLAPLPGPTGAARVSSSAPLAAADVPDLLAFAALLVLSRTRDLAQPGLMLVRAPGSESLYAQAAFTDDLTLAQAFGAMQISDDLDADCQALDFSVRPIEQDVAVLSTDTLYFKGLPDARIALTLLPGKLIASAVYAQDFLEKTALLIEQLQLHGDRPLSALRLLTETGRRIMADPTQAIVPRLYEATPQTFLRIAAQHADQPAISDGLRSYDYRTLKDAVQFLAAELLHADLRPGDTVLVSGPSSFGTIAGFVAVLLAGGVLVSLDPTLPEDRQKQIIKLSKARFAIFATGSSAAPTKRLVDNAFNIAAWPDADELRRLAGGARVNVPIDQEASAYVFFTSGSTGAPKGVLGAHQGLAHFLDWQRTEFPLGPGDRSAQITALSFDVVLRDIFYPLTSGACIHIPERPVVFDARRMLAWMLEHRITILHSVPSLMKAWLQSDTSARPFQTLKYVFFAGEPLSDDLLQRFQAAASEAVTITNLYGPTETTLAKLFNRLRTIEPGIQAIGKPQPGVDVLILKDRKTLCGLDEIGEIAIRTPYRSKGYFRAPELTSEVFLPNPWRQEPGDWVYCTGDLGKCREDGSIQIFGRIDSQIKIRGVRIEPSEIEAHILKYPGVANVAVSTRMGNNQEKTLYAFVTLAREVETGKFNREMREFLKTRLPEVMIPKRLIQLAEIPHLPNGKVNRKALAALEITEETDGSALNLNALDENSRRLVAGFERALGYKFQNAEASFLDHGGDSLSFIQASLTVEEVLGWLPDDWENLSLRELAALKQDKRATMMNISSIILLRALSIVFVVLNYFEATGIRGTTPALFVASGWSFGRYLIPAIGKASSIKPVFRLLFKILLPVYLYTLFLHAALREPLPWQQILLLTNLIDPALGGGFSYWFIEALTQILVFCALLLSIRRVRQAAMANLARFSFLAILIALAASFTINQFWNTDHLYNRVPHITIWLFFMGMTISAASANSQKITIGAIALAAAALFQLTGSATFDIPLYTLGAVLFCTGFSQVRVPAWLVPYIFNTASASLFIYMTHFQFHRAFEKVLPNAHPLATGLMAVVGGIVIWKIWDVVHDQAVNWIQLKLKPAQQEAKPVS